MTRSLHARTLGCSLLTLAFLAPSCGGGEDAPKSNNADQLARELAAAQFNKANPDRKKAREALEPLVQRAKPELRDLVHAGVVEMELARIAGADNSAARALFERAAKIDANDPALNYNLGLLAESEADYASAAAAFRKVLAAGANDTPTKVHLAGALEESEPGEAERVLREVISGGLVNEGAWYVSAVYKLFSIIKNDDARAAEAKALMEEYKQLGARDLKAPKDEEFDLGNLGRVTWPGPNGTAPAAAGREWKLGAATAIAPELAGSTKLLVRDVDGDGALDLVGYGPNGLIIALQTPGSVWTSRKVFDGPVDLVLVHDLQNNGRADVTEVENSRADFVVATGGALSFLAAPADVKAPLDWRKLALPALPSAPTSALAVDFDHEGDVDLLFVGAFGARILRNDGAGKEGGAFTDVSAAASMPTSGAFTWCLAEDFDTDQDVDLLLGGAGGFTLLSNLRGGKFEPRPEWIAGVAPSAIAPVLADFDGDARPDVFSAGDGRVHLRNFDRSLKAGAAPNGVEGLAQARELLALDLDLNGALDVAWESGGALQVRYDVGLPSERAGKWALGVGANAALVDDLDGDLAWDALALNERGVAWQRGELAGANVVRLALRGRKDNRRGVGAVVELRAGPIYRRTFWNGGTTLLGVGEQRELDILRVTWPNGVIQYQLERTLGQRADAGEGASAALLQQEGLVGSCPFLYSWNGREFEFISDVLGGTPLGLPIAPGMLVPPRSDEYVLVKGEQLVARDGVFELQFTEELREVTYLDRVRLDVVDSPAGGEIFPNELFCFPPFPKPHTHTVRGALTPLKALGSDGVDWSKELAAIDDTYAAPFQPAPPQFLGLATPHWIEFEFDLERVRSAKLLRLVATGWFYWTDASVNMASAFDATQEFVPPMLQVQAEDGSWRPAAPPLGFPSGKTKTMVVDVTNLVPRDTARFRLFSTLRLYWDSVRLAVDDDDAPLRTTSLEPSSAKLWRRGFSQPLPPRSTREPERFDWEVLAERPRWNQHPGLYTRFGECVELLGAADDRYIIMGSGDALTLRFDAKALPPLEPGQRRDYLVYLDGWAKDRDPNTHEALTVEPLPFHGMSGYPYRADESFPDTPEHREWRRKWNTRAAVAPIERLATRP